MISHVYRCIFVHIPRTGGSSIEDIIWPDGRSTSDLWMGFAAPHRNKYQTGGLQHLTARHIRSEVGERIFQSYFKFTVVRNPWDKAVSQFAYMATRPDLRDFIGLPDGSDFPTYLCTIGHKLHVQWAPQLDFILDADGTLLVDAVIRFETLTRDLPLLLKRLGVEVPQTLPHVNASKRLADHRGYYDAESKLLLSTYYEKDLAYFRYCF
jgi:sulfotransferase famil protein